MKKLILSLPALCLYSLVMAQQAKSAFLERINSPRTAGKTTGQESRLIGQAIWQFAAGTLKPHDSSYCSYSPNNGWDPVQGDWKFDTAVEMNHDGTAYENSIRHTNTFDAQKNLTQHLQEGWDGSSWKPQSKALYAYTAQRHIATQEFQQLDNATWKTSFKSTNTYDAQGRITENINQSDQGSGLKNVTRNVTTYNGLGLAVTETNYLWDAAGGQWTENFKTTYSYNGAMLTSAMSAVSQAGAWNNVGEVIYTRDANGNITEEERKGLVGGTWRTGYKYINTYDAAGNMINSIGQNGQTGTLINEAQITTTYNSNKQALVEVYKSWDAASNSFQFANGDGEYHYHYEQFTNSVKDAAIAAGAMRVHPMPASNKLNLNLKWNDAQTATVVLFDMTGKVAGQWSTPAAAQHMQTLDVSNIPAGTYMLKVMGTKGVLSQQVNIVK